jgi:hypothetical protein
MGGILFAQALTIIPHLSSGGLYKMLHEHLSRCFIPKDPSSGFLKLFQTVIVVAHGNILRSMALMLVANRLLAMAKDICGLCPIAVSEMFIQLINRSIILQLRGPFQEHLSPHQFRVSTLGGCEAIPFGIRTFLNLHFDWVVMQINIKNDFNNVY